MIEAFEIASLLKLDDRITPTLLKISEKFTALETQIGKVQEGLNLLRREGRELGAVNTELKALAGSAGTLAKDMGRAATSTLKLSDRLGAIQASGMERAAIATRDLSEDLTRATNRAALLKNEMRAINGGGIGGGGGGGGRGGHGGIHGPRAHFGPHGVGIGAMGLGGGDYMPGLMAIGAGVVGGHIVHGWLHAANEYQSAVTRFQGLNLGAATNADMVHFANSQNLNGVNSIDLVNTIRDLHTVMGNYDHAKELAPLFARMQFANQAVYGEHGNKMSEKQMADLGRVIDMRNAWHSPAEMRQNADMMQRVVSGTGGMVLPSEYRMMLGTGGIAAKNLDANVFYYAMEPIIQEMKSGSKVGSGLTAANNNLGLGKTTKAAALYMAQMGLVDPKNFVKGSGWRAGTLKGDELRKSNPIAWTNEILVPAIKKWLTGHHMAQTDSNITNMISAVMTNTRGATLYSMFYQQLAKIQRAMKIDANSAGVDQIQSMADKSYQGNLIAFSKEWTEFKKVLGVTLLPTATSWLHGFTGELRDLVEVAKRHPTIVKTLTMAFVGLAGALAFGGVVSVLRVAFKGLAAALGFSKTAEAAAAALKAVDGAVAMTEAGGTAGVVKKAWSLRLLSGALSMLTSPVGALLTILAGAGYAGYKAYGAYQDLRKDQAATEALGVAHHSQRDAINKQLAAVGQPPLGKYEDTANGLKRLDIVKRSMSGGWKPAPVHAGSHQKVSFTVPVYLDGHQIAMATADHFAKAGDGPQRGISGFDGHATQHPVGYA